jgi:16S rRNA (guanine527-N7)-methyltransferase
MTDALQQLFVDRVASLGVKFQEPEKQLAQFESYFRLLVDWNEKMNLTGIVDREAVYEKHFYDSLTLAKALDLNQLQSLVDVGSGAGFPSLPLKIAYPHLKITIIDALAKRIRFLETVVSTLQLQDVACLHGRAETLGRDAAHRDRYDAASARAVARLAALNELCLPLVRPGGVFVAMKGADVQAELAESQYSAKLLNSTVKTTISLTLPGEGSIRHLIVMEKQGRTPKAYPRKPGIPVKQPLIAGNNPS